MVSEYNKLEKINFIFIMRLNNEDHYLKIFKIQIQTLNFLIHSIFIQITHFQNNL